MIAAFLLAVICTPLPTCPVGEVLAPAVVVQHVYVGAAYAVPVTLALPAPVVEGSTVVVAIRAASHSRHVFAVTDSRGTVYAKAVQLNQTNDTASVAIYYAGGVPAGPLSVTVADAATIGWTRFAVVEVSGVGSLVATTMAQGTGTDAMTPTPGLPGNFVLTAFATKLDAVFTAGPGGVAIESQGKLFVEHGSSEATYSPAANYGAISVAFGGGSGPCATPTPVVMWDQLPDADLFGYELYARVGGDTLAPVALFPCEYLDTDDDGAPDFQSCRGANFGVALQRHLPLIEEYEVAVKAVDNAMNRSLQFSIPITVCMPPIYAIGSQTRYE